jgi:N-acetylmuramic acid 6-phosphate etherase
MVDMIASNDKLVARAVSIVMEATGCSAEIARMALDQTGRNAKLAIMVVLTGKSPEDAREALENADGFLRRALGDGK